MGDWTAITGIVISGAVGPGIGAALASRYQRRQLEFDATERDKAELRDLLDAAAQSLEQNGRALFRVSNALLLYGAQIGEKGSAQVSAMTDAVREFGELNERLVIRLGDTAKIAAPLTDAERTLREASEAIVSVAALGLRADLKDADERFDRALKSFGVARIAFRAAAFELVGSRLVPN